LVLLQNRQISGAKIKQNAISTYEIADGTVTSTDILDNTITDGDISATADIDPVKVVKSSISNAVSVGSVILTTEAVITDLPEPKDSASAGGAPGGMPPGMGGMDF